MASEISKLRDTLSAAEYFTSPDCVAVREQVPALSIVMVVPATVQTGVVVEFNATDRLDVAVGKRLNVLADHGRSMGAAKVIDCEA